MDTKDVKAALKSARECIREKQFKEALKSCKSVLAHDKNNYNALVFVGVAAEGMEQFDQAEKAYKRATEAAPDQILAWQGLCGFYEKHPDHDSDLVNVYQKLQELYKGDTEKKNEILKKLADLDVKIGATAMAIGIYEDLVKREQNDEKKQKYMYRLEEILRNEKNLTVEWKTLYLSTCDMLFELDHVQFEDTKAVVKFYVQCMLEMQFVGSKLEFKCRKLHEKFPDTNYPVEILMVITMDKHIGEKFPVIDPGLEDCISKVSTLSPDSSYLLAGQGYIQLCSKKFIEARDCFSRAVVQLPKVASVHYYYALVLKHLHDFSEAEKSCQTCLKTLERKDRVLTVTNSLCNTVMYLQAEVMYRIGTVPSLQAALDIIQQISYLPVGLLKGHVYLKLGDLENAENCLEEESSEMEALSGCILYYKKKYEEAAIKLKSCTEADCSNSDYLLWYAKALWEKYKTSKDKTDIETSYTSLLKSAKLDPYNAATFLYLGHFSLDIQNDKIRARKCFQKSFDLDPTCEEAGAALCDLLTSSDQEEEAYKLLLSVTSKASAGCGKWAWLRLGLYQVKHDSANSAVTSFQAALRGDPKDNHVWECLAEAYYHRGSYTAALKAFTKASELDPDSVYCLYHIAAIKQTLGMYAESIEEYKLILRRDAEYVPALKGIGETYLLLAKHNFSQFFNGKARDYCQEALIYLARAATHRPDLSCLWKFMGDACTIVYPMAKETFRMEVPMKLLEKSGCESSSLSLIQTLELGARCYGRALKDLPDCASLWHDLGFNLYHQSQQCDSMTTIAEKAVNAFKKALSLDSTNYLHWNALGVLSSSKGAYNPSLAQHCFIQSIKAEANNHVAWTNLATLYLTSENIHLAHEAFKMAQRLEPSYVAAWIGQALIAETVGDEDAMDLFRHTTELATHVEGANGYGSWVCTMLQDESKHNTDLYKYSIQQMAAVPSASTVLGKYLDRIKTNATAYNMYGILLEQQHLYRSAAQAFKSALNCDNCKDEQKVRINLARVLCKLEQFAEAMSQYDQVEMPTNFNDLCSFGYVCYQSGKYKESYQAYQQALELATEDHEKSHVYTALGMVAYKFGDLDGAKAVLLQSSQLKPPSINGLKSLCALGITLSDNTLTMAVLRELFSHGNSSTQTDFSNLMTISHCLLENNFKGAKTYIQQCIHTNPNQAKLWKLLSKLLLRHFPECKGSVAASCAECAYQLDPFMHNIQNLVTVNLLRSNDVSGTRLVRSAVKALHIQPDIHENWKNLLSSIDIQSQKNEKMQYWIQLRDSYSTWVTHKSQ